MWFTHGALSAAVPFADAVALATTPIWTNRWLATGGWLASRKSTMYTSVMHAHGRKILPAVQARHVQSLAVKSAPGIQLYVDLLVELLDLLFVNLRELWPLQLHGRRPVPATGARVQTRLFLGAFPKIR